MITVSAGRSPRNRRWVPSAVGTSTAAMMGRGYGQCRRTVHLVSLRPPAIPRRTTPRLTSAYSPGVDPLISHGLDPLVHTDPRYAIPEGRPGQSPARAPAAPPDPMLAPVDACNPPEPDFHPTSQ
jgi:hypothetical protein